MIHYGLQFGRLIEEAAADAARKRGTLSDAARREREARQQLAESARELAEAEKAAEASREALNVALQAGPFEAVNSYNAKHGRYPI
jgi:ABC-type transporter Mla subunit MlaD